MVSSHDPHIADLEFNEMSREQRHAQICAACGLKDSMYSLVWVVDTQKKGLPNVECRACLASMRGGPEKFMIHNIAEVAGVATCKSVGASSNYRGRARGKDCARAFRREGKRKARQKAQGGPTRESATGQARGGGAAAVSRRVGIGAAGDRGGQLEA